MIRDTESESLSKQVKEFEMIPSIIEKKTIFIEKQAWAELLSLHP